MTKLNGLLYGKYQVLCSVIKTELYSVLEKYTSAKIQVIKVERRGVIM